MHFLGSSKDSVQDWDMANKSLLVKVTKLVSFIFYLFTAYIYASHLTVKLLSRESPFSLKTTYIFLKYFQLSSCSILLCSHFV